MCAFHYFDGGAFRAATAIAAFHAREHVIAVHGVAHRIASKKQIAVNSGNRLVGNYKSVALLMSNNASANLASIGARRLLRRAAGSRRMHSIICAGLDTSFRSAWRAGYRIALRLSSAIWNCRQPESSVAHFLNFATAAQPDNHFGKAAAAIVLKAQFTGDLAKAHRQRGFGH